MTKYSPQLSTKRHHRDLRSLSIISQTNASKLGTRARKGQSKQTPAESYPLEAADHCAGHAPVAFLHLHRVRYLSNHGRTCARLIALVTFATLALVTHRIVSATFRRWYHRLLSQATTPGAISGIAKCRISNLYETGWCPVEP